jgi:hypothetical protein
MNPAPPEMHYVYLLKSEKVNGYISDIHRI